MDTPQQGKFMNHENARTEEQKKLMAKIEEDGVCPFCAEHFKKYHPKPILKETDAWFVTENMSPYKGTTIHLLFVYKRGHVTMPHDITPADRAELFELIDEAITQNNILGGSFFMRFGDIRYNGSSVQHLHAHLIVGDAGDPNHEPVRVKLG